MCNYGDFKMYAFVNLIFSDKNKYPAANHMSFLSVCESGSYIFHALTPRQLGALGFRGPCASLSHLCLPQRAAGNSFLLQPQKKPDVLMTALHTPQF